MPSNLDSDLITFTYLNLQKIGSSIHKYTLMLIDMKSIFDDRDYLTYNDLILKKKIQFGWLYQRLKSMLFEIFQSQMTLERLENRTNIAIFCRCLSKFLHFFLLIICNITV